MSEHLEIWTTKNSLWLQRAVLIVMIAAGLALTIGFRHFDTSGITQSLSGFLLGLLLVCVGVGALLFGGNTTITVDPRRRQIVISGTTLFKQTSEVIEFNDISSFSVEEEGDNEGGSSRYYVAARLNSGRYVRLFYGFFDGMFSKAAMENRMRRLILYHQPRI